MLQTLKGFPLFPSFITDSEFLFLVFPQYGDSSWDKVFDDNLSAEKIAWESRRAKFNFFVERRKGLLLRCGESALHTIGEFEISRESERTLLTLQYPLNTQRLG